MLLGRAQPVIPPNLYYNEHNSLGSPGNTNANMHCTARIPLFFEVKEFTARSLSHKVKDTSKMSGYK